MTTGFEGYDYVTKGDRVMAAAWEIYYELAECAEEEGLFWEPTSLMKQAASDAANSYAASDADADALYDETLRAMLASTEAPA